MERVVQYVKDGTEAFDDSFQVGGRRLESGQAFEHLLNWLLALIYTQVFVLDNRDLEGEWSLPLYWREFPWLNGLCQMLLL